MRRAFSRFRLLANTYENFVRYNKMSSFVSRYRILELGKVVDHDRLSISRYRTTLAHVHCACALPFLVSSCWQKKTYENCIKYNRMSSVVSKIVALGKVEDHDRLSISRYRTTMANVHGACAVPLFRVVGNACAV